MLEPGKVAERSIREEPESFRSGRAIEKLVVTEYIRQIGDERSRSG